MIARLIEHTSALARFGLHCLIRAYQLVLRPVLGPNCRFVPGCSDYAIEAIGLHGVVGGSGLAAARILRCNPWHAGGYDPVPPLPCSCGTTRSAPALSRNSSPNPSHDRDRLFR